MNIISTVDTGTTFQTSKAIFSVILCKRLYKQLPHFSEHNTSPPLGSKGNHSSIV